MSLPASVETWIDALCKVFEVSADDGGFNIVKSYRMFELNELPDVVMPELVPCAISYVTDLELEYGAGSPTIFYWSGQTEFHLTKDVRPANHAFLMPFYRRIVASAGANMKLGNTAELFLILQNTPGAVQSVIFRNAQGQDDHQGLMVKWTVKQNVSGQYTISA